MRNVYGVLYSFVWISRSLYIIERMEASCVGASTQRHEVSRAEVLRPARGEEGSLLDGSWCGRKV